MIPPDARLEETSVVVDKTPIHGLRWEANPHFKTGKQSRIVVTSENGMFTTIVWHGEDPSDAEYPHFALHLAGDDRLTFINGKQIRGEFVDCRQGSDTLHKHIVLEWDGNPERRLVVPAGVAHWFRNLAGVVTRNEPILRWDSDPDPLFLKGIDVFNIHPTQEANKFPVVRPHRYVLPTEFHEAFAKRQRAWAHDLKYFPTRVQVGNSIYLLAPQDEEGPAGDALRKLPRLPT